MKEITQFEALTIEIWRRPFQRNMHLTVRPDGCVRVTCNRRRSRREIIHFVSESKNFITKRFLEIELHRKRFPPKEYVSGESFLLRGERVPLQVVWSWNARIRVRQTAGELEMLAPVTSTQEERAGALKNFYRGLARKVLPQKVEQFAPLMQLFPRQLSIRGQSTRWGSCSARGEISLNWKLLATPEEVMDYVVIHELAHLKHLNHSKDFWGLVARYHPEWRARKKWLREYESELAVQFQRSVKGRPIESKL